MTKEHRFDCLRRGNEIEGASTGRPRITVPACLVLFSVVLWGAAGMAQDGANRAEPAGSWNEAMRALSEQVRQLQQSVAEMRSESEQARAETRQLRRELDELRAGSSERKPMVMEAVARTVANGSLGFDSKGALDTRNGSVQDQDNNREEQKKTGHAASLEEEYELLTGKVDDQYQTKVESASKYRMRISGIVLMNLFSNQGTVDNIDLPTLAFGKPPGYSGGSFGATLRQSQLGFEVFGPRVGGARTRADLQLDLAGGFPAVPDGINSGLLRLRTATMRVDWRNTSVVAGQDALFLSPNSPTSFATLATPALSYAGNLWSWVPQVRVEHRVVLGDNSNFLFQAGILDPVNGETPAGGYYRQPGAGESARQPAYGTRVAWTHEVFGQPLRVGVGGFYSRQVYGFRRRQDAWVGTSDVELPLGRQFSLSGKFYRGRALGGLYGGIGQSVLFSGDPTSQYSDLIGLNTVGGWAQLKYRPATKLEFNAAFGMDNPYARDLEHFLYPQTYAGKPWSANRSGFFNVIYRPRSDLLFSAEYRRLTSSFLGASGESAGQLNLMMGVLF